MAFFIQGLLLGLAYVAPIGMQNMYVINSAARLTRRRAYTVAAITIFFDISLAFTCYFGIGLLLDNLPLIKDVILGIGTLAVIWIGISLLRSNPAMDESIDVNQPIIRTIAVCFAVTWLNPQAIIDGSLFLGSFRASLPPGTTAFFITGVCCASLVWFTALTTIVSALKHVISTNFLRLVNIVCGAIILLYGCKLGYMFLVSVGLVK